MEINNTWSVNDILANYEKLGIPHFQRGSVWGDENIAALLESLYYNTPCGTIVLWPNKAQENGKPLKEGKSFTHLIIDGQQRTRSLYSVFGENCIQNSAESDDAGEDNKTPYVWAINLYAAAKGSKIEGYLKAKNQPRYRNLFAKIQDPEIRRKNDKDKTFEYPYQYDFLPLKYLNTKVQICCGKSSPEDGNAPCIYFDLNDNAPAENISNELKTFVTQIQANLHNLTEDKRFFVFNLSRDSSLSDVIHTFMRINSGGRPVQAEEKAFARLVQLDNTTAQAVSNIFASVHGPENSKGNDYLKRLKESQFGFRLFIRVFILAMNYHSGRAIGTNGLSFSVIQSEASNLSGKESEIKKLWKITAKCVKAVHKLLEEKLYFDTLAFLPDSRSLLPIFMLLIKYPGFMDENAFEIKESYKNHIACILLTILLKTGDSEGEIMKLTTLIKDVPLSGEKVLQMLLNDNYAWEDNCPKQLRGYNAFKRCGELKAAWQKIKNTRLEEKLAYANSLTNRYVLLLYALERHNKVCDFHGDVLPEASNQNYDWEQFTSSSFVDASKNPEKQHIVPYSAFNHNSELKGRVANSRANNIGNITYISMIQNREALGPYWLHLDRLDENSKIAHSISDDAIDAYYEIAVNDENMSRDGINAYRLEITSDEKKKFNIDPSKNEAYGKWIKARQDKIITDFNSWLGDMGKPKFTTEIISHSEAILLEENNSGADCAFLPRLWSSEKFEEFKEELSWLALTPGTAISHDGKISFQMDIKNSKSKTSFNDLNEARAAIATMK